MLKFDKISNRNIIFFTVILLFVVSLATNYVGGIDVNDYADVAKFFAGDYNTKIRTAHSMLYGFVHTPLVYLFKSLIVMKITSLLWLFLMILSVYYISNKDRRTLLLIIASPIIWYMGPWINPIQLASLLFLWGFYFINKFDKTEKIKYLAYSGILIGLSWSFWNTVFFILFFFIITFFYNRNVNHLLIFLFFTIIGLLPILIFDQVVFGFAFYSIIKHIAANVVVLFSGSIYPETVQILNSAYNYITFILMLPVFVYTLFSRNFFINRKRQIIFLTLSFLFFLSNPQIRYIIFLWPILIIYLAKSLNEKQFRIQLLIFTILSILVVVPYIIQIKYTTNAADFDNVVANFGNWQFSKENRLDIIAQDLEKLVSQYPNEVFLVGNGVDDYAGLARVYWGKEVKEFVSMQDYNLYLKNESTIYEKIFSPIPRIQDRRQIWIGGGLLKNENDETDYSSIKYGIGIDKPLEAEGFQVIEKYDILYLSEKTD